MSGRRLAVTVGTTVCLIGAGGNLLLPLGDRVVTGVDMVRAALFIKESALADNAPPLGVGQVEVEATGPIEVSLFPIVSASNATPQQHRRLSEALERFQSAGLLLPDLAVEFSADTELCDGHFGVFQPGSTPWTIEICTDLDAVYEHELAHAWELANLDDQTRQQFVDHRGYASWNDPTLPWDERGVEGAAFIVQQGLVDLPLPPTLSIENRSRLATFALLTGQPAPRLLRWIGLDSERPELVDCTSR